MFPSSGVLTEMQVFLEVVFRSFLQGDRWKDFQASCAINNCLGSLLRTKIFFSLDIPTVPFVSIWSLLLYKPIS